MSNESILSLSDDVKASMRAYATMAGFLLLGILMISSLVMDHAACNSVNLIEAAVLVLLGTILAFLHKRDLFAMFFIWIGATFSIISIAVMPAFFVSIGILDVFMALAFCLTRNEQRIVVSVLLAIMGVGMIMAFFHQTAVFYATCVIVGVGCIYNAFAIGCERFKLPFRDVLMADEENPSNDGTPVHFKISGTSLCLALWMLVTLCYILFGFRIGTAGAKDQISIFYAVGVVEIVAGMIMLTAGRMRQTPFIFILLGAIALLLSYSNDPNVMTMCALSAILLGALILLRSESRILLGLMILLLGVSMIPTLIDPSMIMVNCAISFVVLALEAYLILALNSDGKLKLI